MIEVENETAMRQFGEHLGRQLVGGEVLELVGDVGAGKTTLVRGIAQGMGVDEIVQSPSFTISRVYAAAGGRQLVHYDFYRLQDAGLMANELAEAISLKNNVVVVEWSGAVEHILPADKLTIEITSPDETVRRLHMKSSGKVSDELKEKIA